MRGYATRYGHPLATAFTPKYARMVPELFDTPHDGDAIAAALPANPRALFTQETLDAIDGKGRHWLVDALAQNELGDWKAKAPIRLYYGSKDVDVTPEESVLTARQMAARGSDIHAVNVGPNGHLESIGAAVPLVVRWLQELTPGLAHPPPA